MKTRTTCTFAALIGGLLLAACRGPGAAPTHRVIEPTVPPVAYNAPIAPTHVPTDTFVVSKTSFTEMGLIWRECEVSEEGYTDWRQAGPCLGHPPPSWSEDDEKKSGARTERGLRLSVGDDIYKFRDHDLNVLRWSTLYKNGWPVRVLLGGALVHSPNVSLQNVSGKVAWEFAGERQKTIIYGGKDLRALYDLDAAYRPYGIGGKSIFVGQKEDAYFIVYDGKRVGLELD